jgi:hypothetical protein
MALTINSSADAGRVPKAPLLAGEINVDADASYPATGYDVSATLPDGVTVRHSEFVPDYDGAALRWFRIVDVSGVPRLKAYASANGAPGAEVAGATDLSGHTGLTVGWIGE